jgi:hypothetical protein
MMNYLLTLVGVYCILIEPQFASCQQFVSVCSPSFMQMSPSPTVWSISSWPST